MTEQLVRFDVPRVSVDFLGDDLSSREKLTVLRYLELDSVIAQIGSQRFGATTRDNIPLKPVRDYVVKNWEAEFVYDLSSRTVPITFRTALVLALFTTRITEHLTKVGEVEVYGSQDVQKAAIKHNLEIPSGLSRIDYAALSPEAKSDLVMPIVGNLSKAQVVAQAGHLFPNGINKEATYLLNPGLIFATMGEESDVITFDQIRNLDVQAAAASAALRDIEAARSWQTLTQKVRQEPKQDESKEKRDYDPNDNSDVPEIKYDPGTTFLQVFPYKEGETPEDLVRAYKRIVKKGYYHGHVDQPHRGEYLEMHLDEKGKLIGFHGFEGYMGDEPERHQYDLLTERIFENDWMDREYRGKNIMKLVEDLRDELNMHKLVLQEAQTKYGQTSFTVEQGFLETLTERFHPEATKAQLEEVLRLAREARKTALVEEEFSGEETHELAVYSDQPVNQETIELDQAILMAIKKHYPTDPGSILGMMFNPRHHADNISDWFTSCASLLLRYKGVLVDTASMFAVLDIAPTNDLNTMKKAYRQIAFQTHPDRTTSLSPTEQLDASDKFIKATSAYVNLQQRAGHIEVNQFAPTFFLGRIKQLFNREIIQD